MTIRELMLKVSQIDFLERLNSKILNTDYEFCCLGELLYPKDLDATRCDKNCDGCLIKILNQDDAILNKE